ncbi:sporulation protein [Betaproteobacteria bacterium]|nr:sporulation protein [Betaproteobacteria bacterium]
MPRINDADDGELQLKKRARRRLVGAIAFAAFAVLALPLVMNHEPPPPAQDVEIRIPGQNDTALAPLQPEAAIIPVPVPVPVEPAALPEPTRITPVMEAAQPPVQPVVTVTQTTPQPTPAQAATASKSETKPAASKSETKPEVKKPTAAEVEAQRAAAILAGKSPDTVAVPKPAATSTAPKPAAPAATQVAATSVPHVVAIGTFSDDANVQNLKQKLNELRIPVYTEALSAPEGKKTRVRAGPFVSREAAEQALVKLKTIGVSGPVVPQ